VLRLIRYERLWFKIGDFAPTGTDRLTQNFRYHHFYPHQPFFSHKTRLNDLSYVIKIWADCSSVLSQSTRLTDGRTDGRTDKQTDRILIARPRLHSMQRVKNDMPEKTKHRTIPVFCSLEVEVFFCMKS